jgi:hypothetical protein
MRHPAAALALGALALAALPLAAAGPSERMQQPQLETVPKTIGNPPAPIGVEEDVYCTGWVGPLDQKFAGFVGGAELVDVKDEYMQGDIVYLDIGANQGVTPGLEFWVVRPDRVLYKYESVTDPIGRIYETPGRLRVICVQDNTSIAEVQHSCTEVVVGDRVLPFEPIPIPLVRRTRPLTSCDGPAVKTTGHILDVKDRASPIATTSIVYLDLGENDGLAPGDFLTVFRPRRLITGERPVLGEIDRTRVELEEKSEVRSILGEVAILKTQSNASEAVVTSMSDIMWAGDAVELK